MYATEIKRRGSLITSRQAEQVSLGIDYRREGSFLGDFLGLKVTEKFVIELRFQVLSGGSRISIILN